ncbi:MAG: restriction endonuclease subunit S [Algoriphagus sp.]|uniref:restriction endonuclease subunit S n=1 Tax=Algoriphagus sp. TaxID=1872435 RepID=UPI00273061E0|nr:restriction endonuclease subunit S [Algoriphagus sp.]MDP2041845.1 restriction endonuclease subunit S [Algoriphagus sp.]MDP3473151.1 restriction endonuclease subunit S [Algoriphagus sp.]
MSEKRNVPKLRFPFFGTWEEKKIQEIAPLQRGFDLPVSQIEEGEFPVVFSNGMLKYHTQFKVEAPGIVTGRSGTIGNVTFVEKNFWPHNTSLWITNFFGNEPKFIYYFYINLKLDRFGTGSGVPTLNRNDIHILTSHIPSIQEQQKIAEFLTAVDRRIELLQAKKKKLEAYKKGVMQQIFSQKLRFKADDGSDFLDWEERKLAEVARIFDGTHQTPKYVKEGIPFYSVEHVTANQFTKTKYISKKVFDAESKRVKLEKGDILMTRIGSIGVAKVIDWDVNASFYVSLALLKTNSTTDSKFLSFCIANVDFQKELWKRTIHVAFPQKINLGEIGECRVIMPVLDEQIKIAKFLTGLDTSIENLNQQINHTQTWKKGLLQKMFV